MSRTIRRKNFEATRGSSWARRGSKTAGYYTEYDFDPSWRWLPVFRAPTKEERYQSVRWAHGESRTNVERSPSHWHRHYRMTQNRMINKCELIKCIKDSEYDPIFEADPRSHYWDWD